MDKTTLTVKKRALILLAVHNASGKRLTHRQIAESLDVSTSTVNCTIKRFVERGVLMNISRFIETPNKTMSVKYRETSRHACSSYPAAQHLKDSSWSLKLLRD